MAGRRVPAAGRAPSRPSTSWPRAADSAAKRGLNSAGPISLRSGGPRRCVRIGGADAPGESRRAGRARPRRRRPRTGTTDRRRSRTGRLGSRPHTHGPAVCLPRRPVVPIVGACLGREDHPRRRRDGLGPTMVNDVIHTRRWPAAACPARRRRGPAAAGLRLRGQCSTPRGGPRGAGTARPRPPTPSRCRLRDEQRRARAASGTASGTTEVPNRHGAHQINGEKRRPGAVFHSLRGVATPLRSAATSSGTRPDTFLINLPTRSAR